MMVLIVMMMELTAHFVYKLNLFTEHTRVSSPSHRQCCQQIHLHSCILAIYTIVSIEEKFEKNIENVKSVMPF